MVPLVARLHYKHMLVPHQVTALCISLENMEAMVVTVDVHTHQIKKVEREVSKAI